MSNKYQQKENYVTVHPDPDVWRHHANYYILCHYKEYIKGVVGDFGANHGGCSLLLLDNEAVTSIYPIDMNAQALQIGCQKAAEIQPKIPVNFTVASLFDIPLQNDAFDTIVSFHTLEDIYPEDAPKFVKKLTEP